MAVFMIRCVDQHSMGNYPFWNSKANGGAGGWVPDRIDATTYTEAQRLCHEQRRKVPERGMWEAMEVTPQSFHDFLVKCLDQAVRASPDLYFYGPDAVPEKAAKLIAALRDGNAQIGPTVKRVAKGMGLKATQGSLQAFLNGGTGDPA